MKKSIYYLFIILFIIFFSNACVLKNTVRNKINKVALPKVSKNLTFKVRPKDAKVTVKQLYEKNDILVVKVTINDYGTYKLRGKATKSQQSGIILYKDNYITQRYEIYKPVKNAIIKMPKVKDNQWIKRKHLSGYLIFINYL